MERKFNFLILALGISYFIIGIGYLTKIFDLNDKFYLAISITSFIISVKEVIVSIVSFSIEFNNKYLFEIKNNSTKDELLQVKKDLNKIQLIIKILSFVYYFIELCSYVIVFIIIIIIPYQRIPNNIIISLSNHSSILCFSFLFISIYINQLLEQFKVDYIKGIETVKSDYYSLKKRKKRNK